MSHMTNSIGRKTDVSKVPNIESTMDQQARGSDNNDTEAIVSFREETTSKPNSRMGEESSFWAKQFNGLWAHKHSPWEAATIPNKPKPTRKKKVLDYCPETSYFPEIGFLAPHPRAESQGRFRPNRDYHQNKINSIANPPEEQFSIPGKKIVERHSYTPSTAKLTGTSSTHLYHPRIAKVPDMPLGRRVIQTSSRVHEHHRPPTKVKFRVAPAQSHEKATFRGPEMDFFARKANHFAIPSVWKPSQENRDFKTSAQLGHGDVGRRPGGNNGGGKVHALRPGEYATRMLRKYG